MRFANRSVSRPRLLYTVNPKSPALAPNVSITVVVVILLESIFLLTKVSLNNLILVIPRKLAKLSNEFIGVAVLLKVGLVPFTAPSKI